MPGFRDFQYAVNKKELGLINWAQRVMHGEDTPNAELSDSTIVGLDNPEFFLRLHGEKAPADLSLQELQERYEKYGLETPISGDDIGKMGLLRLKPGKNRERLRTTSQPGTTHIYRTMPYYTPTGNQRPLTPPDRGSDPNRQPGV